MQYRIPSYKHGSPEFENFLRYFKNLHAKIVSKNHYATFYSGDFNGHSKAWWPMSGINAQGREIYDLFTSLNLSQIISEPTNFQPNKQH